MLNIRQRLFDFTMPKVMAIVNLTDDSFLASSRCPTKASLIERMEQSISEGADIIDAGACSTRPGSVPISVEEELLRLRSGLEIIAERYPSVVLSVDTFRAEVAKEVLKNFPVSIINDVSGVEFREMASVIADNNAVYVLTYNEPNDCGAENTVHNALRWLGRRVDFLRQNGVKDIIVDPGFGFNKTLKDNYLLLKNLHELQVLGCPILVGVSHKSMFYKPLGLDAENVLPATLTAQAWALRSGCDILRVHDVKEAVQQIKVAELLNCGGYVIE